MVSLVEPVETKDPLTKTQRLLYNAYSIDYEGDDLDKKMGEYWTHVKGEENQSYMYMFTSRPDSVPENFKSFPFIKKKQNGETFSNDDIINLNYLHRLVKRLHYDDQTRMADVGARLISSIKDNDLRWAMRRKLNTRNLSNQIKENDLRLANSMLDGFAPKDLIEEMKQIQGDIYKASGELKPTPKREREERGYDVPVVAASIHIDTSREGFENARYDVSKLIRSIAKFSVDDENYDSYVDGFSDTNGVQMNKWPSCDTPGKRLQGYHNSLYAKAQSTLNRLSHQQEAINEYRMRHIKREWDHYAVFCKTDIFRLPPGYNPVPHTNSWITNSNTKFTKMDPALHEKLIKKKVWDLKDYLYFDPTLVTDNAGFEAWQQWAEKEKRQYSIYCLEEFVKPHDWTPLDEIPDGEEPNKLEAISARFNKLRPFKDRKRVKPPSPVYLPPDLTYLDAMSLSELKEEQRNIMLLRQTENRADFTRDEEAKYNRAGELIKEKEEEERRRQEEERLRQEAEAKRIKCDNSFMKREQSLENELRAGDGEIIGNAIQKNNQTYAAVRGMEALIKEEGIEEDCENDEKLNEAAKKLFQFVKDEGAKINEQLMRKAVGKWVEIDTNKQILNRLTITKKGSKITSVRKGGLVINTDFAQLLEGKFGLSVVSKLRGNRDVISELVSTALLPYGKEPLVTVNLEVMGQAKNVYKFKDGNKTKYLRSINEDEKAYLNFVRLFNDMTTPSVTNPNPRKFKHVIPVNILVDKDDGGSIDAKQEDDGFTYLTLGNKRFKFVDEIENVSEPLKPFEPEGLDKVKVFFEQEKVGDTLGSWIKTTYYQEIKDAELENGWNITKDKVKIVKNTKNEQLRDDVFKIIKSAKEGIDEFHSISPGRFIHHDIKTDNLTIDANNVVHVFDFDMVIDTELGFEDATVPQKILVPRVGQKNKYDDKINDRFRTKGNMLKYLDIAAPITFDYHQLGLAALQLGGIFDWQDEFDFSLVNTDESGDERLSHIGQQETKFLFWNQGSGDGNTPNIDNVKINNFWSTVLQNGKFEVKRGDQFITSYRNASSKNPQRTFNLSTEASEYVWYQLFLTTDEMKAKATGTQKALQDLGDSVQSPMQFISQSRQPVFERVQIESDYGDDEDLEALMEYDPLLDGEKIEVSSHISDAEFDRMLNEATDYDALNKHIEQQNKAYSDHSTEVEEDAKSVSSKHSNASEVSVASQMSNMSSNSVASNMSAASNISAASNMSAHSVASNLSAASEKSNMSEMSNHSYASNHSMESEEAYPTSEHSNDSYGKYSEQSYNQTSSYGNSSSHSSSESSGRELGYSNGLSESSDHGMSSDHESSNESMGYSSSGGSSSNNHSYNSSSDTES